MSKTEVAVDTAQVKRLLSALGGKETKQAAIGTLRKSAKILQDETERQFKSKVNIDGVRVAYKSKSGKEKKKWKRVATVKINNKELSAKVHIMSDYRAKWFELGTRKRVTKGHKVTGYYTLRPGGGARRYKSRTGKGGNRGRIKAWHLFQKAQQLTERLIFDNMEKEMSKQIQRIAKKNGRA
ncbi:MAG: hypothetical protein LBR26_09495 [Prevotella sp.]|jgi:hypothetical protein|nr:hypothetical protein [Prevotella sp.]